MTKYKILFIASLTFLTLLSLSCIYYKERTCFLDISFHLFYILKDGDFAIQNNRFGAFFTQSFPFIGSKFAVSLNNIAIAYSMSFVILPFLTFILIHLGMKNSKISVAYILFVMLMTTHTFYWVQSELPQAISFLFMLIALLDNIVNTDREPTPYFWTISSVLIFIVCFTHPLIVFPFSFVLTYYYILYPEKRKIIYVFGFFYFSILVIKSLFFNTPYESQAMGGIKNFANLFPHYFNLQSNKNLLHYFVHDYYFVIILFIAFLMYCFKQRLYNKIFLLSSYFVGFCFVVNVSYPNGAAQFYLENQYLILSFFVCLPFTFEVLPQIKNSKIQYGILCMIFAIGIFRIINTHQFYTNRLNWNRNLLLQTEVLPNKKLIISSSKAPEDTLLMTWASSYELWLLSTIEKGISRSIIIEENENEFDEAFLANKSFISKWEAFDYSTLNKKYFVFTDTTNYFKIQ
jgi:hypothetical protein